MSKYYRNPRTRNEERHNQDEYEGSSKQQAWCRAKRRPCHLADSWWDKHSCVQKTWKEHRKTKYRPGRRGKTHSITLKEWRDEWKLIDYLESHDIPHRIEEIKQGCGTYKQPIWKKKVIGKKPIYRTRYEKINGVKTLTTKLWFYADDVRWVKVGYKEYPQTRIVGYKITWWYDKDIGIEYILNKEHRYA